MEQGNRIQVRFRWLFVLPVILNPKDFGQTFFKGSCFNLCRISSCDVPRNDPDFAALPIV